MAAQVRFHLDESVTTAVADALNQRGIDVTTPVQAGLLSASDEKHLAFALAEGRVMITHDADLLRLHAEGSEHAGIAYCAAQTRTVVQMVECLSLIHAVLEADEMKNRVEYP